MGWANRRTPRRQERLSEKAHLSWVRRFIFFHGKCHPRASASPRSTLSWPLDVERQRVGVHVEPGSERSCGHVLAGGCHPADQEGRPHLTAGVCDEILQSTIVRVVGLTSLVVRGKIGRALPAWRQTEPDRNVGRVPSMWRLSTRYSSRARPPEIFV